MVMVGVYKEKELKDEKARPFNKTTAKARLYQTATEKNIADNLLPFFPQQTMNMSEFDLSEFDPSMNANPNRET